MPAPPIIHVKSAKMTMAWNTPNRLESLTSPDCPTADYHFGVSQALEINASKTKELAIKNGIEGIKPITIKGQIVEMVNDFKYLGTYIDGKLTFKENTDFIFKRCSQRLYLLRKLNFAVNQNILETI